MQGRILRTDDGGEYRIVGRYVCKSTRVIKQISKDNKAKRMHRTVLNMSRCMIFLSGLPLHFWGDVVQCTAYVLNRALPLEILTGKRPSISDIVVFESPCTVYCDPGRKAWNPRAKVGVIVGNHDET